MSFRGKLAIFFFLVVVVPMVSVAFVLFRLVDDNETSKADARLASRQEVAVNLTRELRVAGDRVAEQVIADPRVAAALRRQDEHALNVRLMVLRTAHGRSPDRDRPPPRRARRHRWATADLPDLPRARRRQRPLAGHARGLGRALPCRSPAVSRG